MKKAFGALMLLALLAAFAACSEKEEEGEYDNWQARNEHYVDSIATLARNGTDGWEMMPAFTVSDSIGTSADNKYYIYYQRLQSGTGTYSPQYNDSIRVHYSGRFIPSASYPLGYNFGKSYNGSELNEATDVPSLMCVNQNVVGFATAVMHMVVGDRWKVVVPYYLGYGASSSSSSIPNYSTLIFDMQLARVYRYQIDTDTSWW